MSNWCNLVKKLIESFYAFEKMTGWTKEEVIGKTPRILQGPGTDHEIFKNLIDKLHRGETWSGRTINYRKDGSEFDVELGVQEVRLLSGKRAFCGYIRDLTQQKLDKRELQRSKKLISARFFGSHKNNDDDGCGRAQTS